MTVVTRKNTSKANGTSQELTGRDLLSDLIRHFDQGRYIWTYVSQRYHGNYMSISFSAGLQSFGLSKSTFHLVV